MTEVLTAALEAHDAGLCVVKVRTDGTKHPVGTWAQYQAVRADRHTVERWFAGGHPALGVVCGTVSGRLEMLEMEGDARRERLDAELVTRLDEAGLGDLFARIAAGYMEDTPRGGWHILFRVTGGEPLPNRKLARRPATPAELAGDPEHRLIDLIETRGEGGFSVIAPSNGTTHPNGRAWTMFGGGFDTIATISVAERDAIYDVCRTLDRTVRTTSGITEIEPEGRPIPARPFTGQVVGRSWMDAVVDHLAATDTLLAALERYGWTYVRDDPQGRPLLRRPGKTEGHSASINERGRFAVFTSSTPFDSVLENRTTYDILDVYAAYEHRGDRLAAGRAIAEQTGILAAWKAEQDQQATPDADTRQRRRVTLTAASTIRLRPVKWLWRDRIALGTLALLGGREGIGKSILTYQLVADITNGMLTGEHTGKARSVLVCATEDSWEHTIAPRLTAAGADLDRVYRIDVTTSEGVTGSLTLPTDMAALEAAVAEVDAAAIVLDPLLSRLSTSLDTHKDAEVRVALEPLVALADRTGAATIGLIHVNKATTTDPLTMLMASRAFAAVARAVLFVAVDPDDQTGRRRYLGQPKNNLGTTDLPMLTFTIESTKVADTVEGEVWTGKIAWQGEDKRSIADVLRNAANPPEEPTELIECSNWLSDYLEINTVQPSKQIKAAAKDAGHKERTLQRARQHIGAGDSSHGFPRTSWWSRPGMTPDQVTAWIDRQATK